MDENAIVAAYDRLISSGQLRPDSAQREIATALGHLAVQLENAPKPKSGFFARFKRNNNGQEAPRGIYLWGGVGRGKSMLMDLFYETIKIDSRLRIHFHEFMLETHRRIHHLRQESQADPIPAVAAEWAEKARLLAFDEMQVTNIADAMILSRLFTALMDKGVTVVITSNRHPTDLYKNGLSRELFLPFIDLLLAKLDVITLDGPTDYRLDRIGGMKNYYVPNGAEATKELDQLFFRMTDFPVEDRENVPSEELPVGDGRTLFVPKSLKGVAVFSFKRLCGEARGAADYLALARRFHTLILVGVPILGPENRNEASRFVTLIDALYEWRVKLFMAADAEPPHLYPTGDGRFEFDRTISRLMEMQSADYLAEGHGLRSEQK